MWGLAPAINAEAAGRAHDDEAVELQLAEPTSDFVVMRTYFLHCLALR